MQENLNLLEKLYAAYERAFVSHDASWLTPSAWAVGGLLVVIAVVAVELAVRWHERKLARIRPALTGRQIAHARAWFAAGSWGSYVLVVVGYVLAHNWS